MLRLVYIAASHVSLSLDITCLLEKTITKYTQQGHNMHVLTYTDTYIHSKIVYIQEDNGKHIIH